MEINLKPQWVVGMTSDEVTLIRKALGRRMHADDLEEAVRLEAKIAHGQEQQARAFTEAYAKLVKNIEKGQQS